MKLLELITTNNWLSVEIILLELYPDEIRSIDGYERIYENLHYIAPKESEIEIVLTQLFDDETDEPSYVDVSGRNQIIEENAITDSLAIEFVPWNEWLGMEISKETLKNFTELEIISHCLYEMTFMGFDENEIQEEFSNLNNTIEEYKNMTDDEKKANTKSWEDLKKELDSEKENSEDENV